MRDNRTDVRARSRRALIGVHTAEVQLLIASQRTARRAAMQAIHAGLSAHHASAVAAVVAKFAGQRAALAGLGESDRVGALRQLSSDEAHELARLALEHAAEKRSMRKASLLTMVPQQRSARRHLRRRNRHQRMVVALQLQARSGRRASLGPRVPQSRYARARSQVGIAGTRH